MAGAGQILKVLGSPRSSNGTTSNTNVILTAVTYPMGGLTPTANAQGYMGGAVRLSEPILGFFTNPLAVANSWTITQVGPNTTNQHFHLISANTLEGVTALTPSPNANGVANNLLHGPYVFNVTVTGTDGSTTSNTITITTVNNAINWGTYDNYFGTYCPKIPTNFSSVPGAQILLSVGANFYKTLTGSGYPQPIIGVDSGNVTFQNQVTLTYADPSRPAIMGSLRLNGVTNLTVTGLTFSGNQGTNVNIVNSKQTIMSFEGTATAPCVNCSFLNITANFSPSTYGGDNSTLLALVGSRNCTAANITCNYIGQGFSQNYLSYDTGFTASNINIRYMYNNLVFFGSLQNSTLTDIFCCSPMIDSDQHIDTFQINLGNYLSNVSIQRYMCVPADGNALWQGGPFENPSFGFTGFIDDGSTTPVPSGKAGNILTVTVVSNAFGPAESMLTIPPTLGLTIVGTTISSGTVVLSQLTRATTDSAYPGRTGTYLINISQNSVTPASIYPGVNSNITWNGIFFAGRAQNGVVINSSNNYIYKNFTTTKATHQNNIAQTAFIGSITNGSNKLIVNGNTIVTAGGSPNQTTWYPTNTGLTFNDVCISPNTTYIPAGTIISSQNTSYPVYIFNGAGEYILSQNAIGSLTNVPMVFTGDIGTANFAPGFEINNVDVPTLHFGNNQLINGFFAGTYSNQYANDVYSSGDNAYFPPAWTVSHVITADLNYQKGGTVNVFNALSVPPSVTPLISANTWNALVANATTSNSSVTNYYNPDSFVSSISTSTWTAMNVSQIKAVYAAAFSPNPGGPLDGGSGVAYGAINFSGNWNDGSNNVLYQ